MSDVIKVGDLVYIPARVVEVHEDGEVLAVTVESVEQHMPDGECSRFHVSVNQVEVPIEGAVAMRDIHFVDTEAGGPAVPLTEMQKAADAEKVAAETVAAQQTDLQGSDK